MKRREFLAQATAASAVLGGVSVSSGLSAPERDDDAESDLPETAFADLERALQAVIESKRIGQPVFVRLTHHAEAKPKEALRRLAMMTEAIRKWMSQPLARVHATGSTKSGQVCLALQFEMGSTAILTFARGKATAEIDLFLLGNHGAIYHDAGAGPLWDSDLTFGNSPADVDLVKLIEQALRSDKPVAPGGGDLP